MPDPATVHDGARRTQAEIFHLLRERICLLAYPPGTVLREADLADEFGVSRTPVRAVLQRLAQAGLIESRDGVGTLVTDLDFARVEDIYRMRMKIAELIGEMAPAPLGPALQEAARALLQRARGLLDAFDIAEYWRINHDLHDMISGVIGNSALREMWDHFYFQSARMWYRRAYAEQGDVAEALVDEIGDVVRAIAERDARALGYVQRNHIAYGLARLQAAESGTPAG